MTRPTKRKAARKAPPAFSWTPKRERFCEEYLVDLNQTAAAARAGFSGRSAKEQGYQLMLVPEIRARIAELQATRAERVEVDQDYVVNKTRAVVEHCTRPGLLFNAHGAVAALTLLARHLGMIRNKVEVTGENGGPVQLQVTVTRRIVRPEAPPADPQSEPTS